MISIEEMQRRILSELQEAGEENVAAMLNTVIEPVEDMEQVHQFRQALKELAQADLVLIATERDRTAGLKPLTKEESLSAIESTPSALIFQAQPGRWAWAAQPRPHIVVTDLGQARADEILEECGYQWWRQKA